MVVSYNYAKKTIFFKLNTISQRDYWAGLWPAWVWLEVYALPVQVLVKFSRTKSTLSFQKYCKPKKNKEDVEGWMEDRGICQCRASGRWGILRSRCFHPARSWHLRMEWEYGMSKKLWENDRKVAFRAKPLRLWTGRLWTFTFKGGALEWVWARCSSKRCLMVRRM